MKKLLTLSLLIFVGSLLAQTTDAQGRKQGYWKKMDEKTQKLIYEGMFKDDKPQGVFKYYYPLVDSVRALVDYKKDGKYAYAKLFHPNGKLMAKGKYLGESIKDSVWTYYDDLGVLMSKENYKNGKKEGKQFVYLPNGKTAEERNFKDGVEHGVFKQFYDGVKLKADGNFINGKQEGKMTYFYPNGIAAATGFYKNGMRNGPWIYKDKEGKVTEKELYEYGQIADKKTTDAFFDKNKVKDTPAPKSGEQKPANKKK